MKGYLIVDLDGTVSNCDHRHELAQAGEWDKFHELCTLDTPYTDMIDMLRHLSHLTLVGCTGRNSKHRSITTQWLFSNGLILDHLLMRADDDYSPAVDLKIKLLEEFFGGKAAVLDNVLMMFEDNDKIVEGLRNYGMTILQPRNGAF